MERTNTLLFQELKKEHKVKCNNEKNALFFYYNDSLYNLNNTTHINSPYFDCKIKKNEEDGYLLIKYNTDDTINIGERNDRLYS